MKLKIIFILGIFSFSIFAKDVYHVENVGLKSKIKTENLKVKEGDNFIQSESFSTVEDLDDNERSLASKIKNSDNPDSKETDKESIKRWKINESLNMSEDKEDTLDLE